MNQSELGKNNAEALESSRNRTFLTVKQFSEAHGWPVGGLRHLIFHKPNGFESVIFRCGSKVLISEKLFFEWIERINQPSEKKQKSR
jgi:hypothetical protein